MEYPSSEQSPPPWLLTFPQYVEKALYDPQWGYYSSGVVQFGDDFNTYGEKWAPLLANRFYEAWKAMVHTGEINNTDPFYIYEFGAGSGAMALRMLNYIKGRAILFRDTPWAKFYNVVKYIVCEISNDLHKRQSKLLSGYVEDGKAKCLQTDARTDDDAIPKGAGVVVSNELIDAFPPHEITLSLNDKGELESAVTVMAATVPAELVKDFDKKVELNDLINDWKLPEKQANDLVERKRRVVTIEEMESIMKDAKNRDQIEMLKWAVPLSEFPTLLNEEEKHLLDGNLQGSSSMLRSIIKKHGPKTIYIHPDTRGYLKKITGFMLKGYVFTLDYGRNSAHYIKDIESQMCVRTYSKTYEKNNIHQTADHVCLHIGQQDITTDINFSDVVALGEEFGLLPTWYGMQEALGGAFLPEFRLLIQDFQLTAGSRKRCNSDVLKQMPPSAPVRYSEMPSLVKLINKGMTLVEAINGAEKLQDKYEAIKKYLDWLSSVNYFTKDRSIFSALQSKFLNYFTDLLKTVHNNHSDQINQNPALLKFFLNAQEYHKIVMQTKKVLLSTIENRQHAKIILDSILSLIMQVPTHSIGPYIESFTKLYSPFLSKINEKHRGLMKEIGDHEVMREYNFTDESDSVKLTTALSRCLRVVEIHNASKTAENWKKQGNQCFKQKNFEQAIECYKNALTYDPNFKEAFLNAALCFKRQNKNNTALEYALKACRIDPFYEKASYQYAVLLIECGQKEKACDMLSHYRNAALKNKAMLKLADQMLGPLQQSGVRVNR